MNRTLCLSLSVTSLLSEMSAPKFLSKSQALGEDRRLLSSIQGRVVEKFKAHYYRYSSNYDSRMRKLIQYIIHSSEIRGLRSS